MTGSVSCLREQCRKLQVENNLIKSKEKEVENKLHIAEDMILALKGRASTSKRYEEQLKLKCSSLEKALDAASCRPPQVVKVPCHEKTKVEMELIKECQKKVRLEGGRDFGGEFGQGRSVVEIDDVVLFCRMKLWLLCPANSRRARQTGRISVNRNGEVSFFCLIFILYGNTVEPL